MRRVIGTALFALIPMLGVVSGAQTVEELTLWTFSPAQEIKYFTLMPSGDVFVNTETQTLVVGGSEGETIWSTNDLRDCGRPRFGYLECRYLDERTQLDFLIDTTRVPYARLVVDERLLLINLVSGETVFDSGDHGLGQVLDHRYALGFDQLLLFSEDGAGDCAISVVRLGDSAPDWTSPVPISKDFQWIGLLEDGTVLAYGKSQTDQRTVAAVDLHAGEIAWTTIDLLSENVRSPRGRRPRVPRPFRDEDGTLVAFLSKDGPIGVGAEGELLWRAAALDGEDPSAISYQGGDLLYLIQDDDLFAVSRVDGDVVWTHEPQSDPHGISLRARGVLVWFEDELNLLELDTGKPIWTAPTTLPEGWQPGRGGYVIGDDTVHVAGEEELVLIDLQDGSATTLAEYRFGDDEVPTRLEFDDGGVLLRSSQNIARYADGEEVFHRYYRPPGVNVWERLASTAAGIPQSLLSYRASEDTERFYYIYFEDRDGDDAHRFGLVRIDKETGDETGRLWMNERNPRYVLDPERQAVYYREGEAVLRAVEF